MCFDATADAELSLAFPGRRKQIQHEPTLTGGYEACIRCKGGCLGHGLTLPPGARASGPPAVICAGQAATGRAPRVRRRATTTVVARATPVSARAKSATFVTVIAFSVGATAASNANKSISATAARTLWRRQYQSVPARNRTANTAAAAGNEIKKMSIVSQVANARPARMRALRALNMECSFRAFKAPAAQPDQAQDRAA